MNRYVITMTLCGVLSLGASAAIAQSAGVRVYVDPATGKLAPAPAQETPPAQPRSVARALAQPQVEAGTTAAGGVVMQLGDRFVGEATVSIGPDGKLSGDCILPRANQEVSP